MKKILCLCDFGEHRSVIMASVLRERGHFAVAGSYVNFCDYLVSKGIMIKKEIETEFDQTIMLNEGGEHFIGRDMPEVTDYEWKQKCTELAIKLGL